MPTRRSRPDPDAALLRRLQSVRGLYARAPEAVIVSRPDGKLDCNVAALRLFGFRRKADFLAVPREATAPPRQPDGRRSGAAARAHLQRAERQGHVTFEWVHRKADGTDFPAQVSLAAFELDGHKLVRATVRDLSEERRVEAERAASEARFRHLAEAHPVPMVVTSLTEDRILYASEPAARLFRTSRKRFLAYPPSRLWADPADRGRGRDLLRKRGTVEELIVRLRRGDGSTFIAGMSGKLIDYDGAPAIVAAVRDLTEQVASDTALRDSERRFRELVELHPTPMVVTSGVEDRVLYLSRAGERLLGLSREEMQLKPASWFWVNPADRERLRAAILANGVIDDMEVRMRRTDGEFWCSLSGRMLEYDGKPALFLTGRDLSRQRETENEIARQREALEQSAKMAAMGSLLAGVSHELNNPLAVVMAQAELLRELAAGSAFAERAATIHAAADRCARIVRTFLALARQKPPAARAFNLNEVSRAAAELLGYGFKSSGIALKLDLARDLPDLNGDADQMAQVVGNLLVNAQQALQQHSGARRIEIATRRAGSGKRVRLRVTDSGPGVPLAIRGRIFEPFFTTKPVGTGTGIGLAMCHNIVASHGGTITVEDAPGGGARFTVVLPVRQGAAAEPAAATERAPGQAQAILLVDDEPELLATLADILAPMAGRIDRAGNGRQALELIARGTYDAILSDLRMPGMDGPTLHAELARRYPDLLKRLIFVTGDTLGLGVAEFLKTAGTPVIEKPFSAAEVRRAVAQALGSNR